MICCLCGESFNVGDMVVRVSLHRVGYLHTSQQFVMAPASMEDGSQEKWAHYICPAMNGAPLELVGAGGRTDV